MGLKFVHLAEINISVNGKRGYLSKQGLEGHLGSRMRSRALELTRNSKRALAFPSFKLIFTISCKLFAIIKCLFSTLLYFCLMPVADTTTLKFIKQYPFNKLSFLGQTMYPNYFSNPAHSIPHKLSPILTMLFPYSCSSFISLKVDNISWNDGYSLCDKVYKPITITNIELWNTFSNGICMFYTESKFL